MDSLQLDHMTAQSICCKLNFSCKLDFSNLFLDAMVVEKNDSQVRYILTMLVEKMIPNYVLLKT